MIVVWIFAVIGFLVVIFLLAFLLSIWWYSGPKPNYHDNGKNSYHNQQNKKKGKQIFDEHSKYVQYLEEY